MSPESLLEIMDLLAAKAYITNGSGLAVIESDKVYVYFNVVTRTYMIRIGVGYT